ncbi:hypothetical protein H310_09717 [Aphanomyces invadans]|uniref:DDE-1 domain-containing protein n=1 Tax=Aphanomyces invadans TaxID=157072 RepID=A0A024TTM4_9STRA|nr:hypothetical protein H310_09717 [Aphanomyces invadans]ETV97383.1 hypothetical protein H310_09717 [Aphanomyces invadans]|eukprot:XP_008874091.1 hypothetical protein H310_09717 [Aphanomyces invadans]
MDTRVWEMYLTDLLKYEIEGPSVIVADNLDCHVCQASHDKVSSELFSVLEPLPKSSTIALEVAPKAPVTTAAEKRLVMIKRTIAAWEEMPTSLIPCSFEKAIPGAPIAP